MTTIKWFNGLNTKEELKQQYRELAKQYHPDINKDVSDDSMKEINAEYDALYTLVIQGVDLNTYHAESTEKQKTDVVALPNAVIIHLVRNKDFNLCHTSGISGINKFGRFICSVKRYTVFDSHARRFYSVTPEDPCKNIRTGFHVCETLGDVDMFIDDLTYVRIRTDKTMRPATLDEVIQFDITHFRNMTMGYLFINSYKELSKIRQNSSYVRYHSFIYVESPIYGNFWAKLKHSEDQSYFAYFVVDGVIIDSVPFELHKLNRKNLSVTYYTEADLISLNAVGVEYVDAMEGADFELPEICNLLKFRKRDYVEDWPLDPVLTRYVRMGVIRIYRHGKDMMGYFDEAKLQEAMLDRKIDLEDIDTIMEQFDHWYNACLKSVKTGVKRDRINLDI